MKSLYASEIIRLVERNEILTAVDLLTFVGPETDLILLLNGLKELNEKDNLDITADIPSMMQAILHVLCVHYPEKAKEYLSNISSEYLLQEMLKDVYDYVINKKEDKLDESNFVGIIAKLKGKIFSEVLNEKYINKFNEFLEKNKVVLDFAWDSGSITAHMINMMNENEKRYISYASIAKVELNNKIKRDYDKRVYNALKALFDKLKDVKTIVYDPNENFSNFHIYDNKGLFKFKFIFNPVQIIKPTNEEWEKEFRTFDKLIVTMTIQENKKRKYVLVPPKINQETTSMLAGRNDIFLPSDAFLKTYGNQLRKFFKKIILTHKEDFMFDAPKIITVDMVYKKDGLLKHILK